MKRFLIKIGIVILICVAVIIISKERIISCPNVEVFTASTTSPLVYEPVNIEVKVVPQEKQRIKSWNIITKEGEWGEVNTVDFADVGDNYIKIEVEWEYQDKDGNWVGGDSNLVTGTKEIPIQVYADIYISSGDNQRVVKDKEAEPLEVYVCDYYFDGVSGVKIDFSGPVKIASVTSDEFGYASTELKTDTAGKYEITASGDDILGSVTFDEIVFEVNISISPTTIAPLGTTNLTITVTAGTVNPMSGWDVSLSAEGVANSGGHFHNENRPHGTPRPNRGTTDINGVVTAFYQSTEVCGKDRIIATIEGYEFTAEVNVSVGNLIALSAGTGYTLVGQTTTHPDNHYGTNTTNNALINIANDFRREYPNGPNLLYNDMSLEQGGLFDINANWQEPHKSHRYGANCDFNFGTLTQEQLDKLIDIIDDYGERLDEGNHWHLTF